MVLKLYCDLMSQPSRSLYILLKSLKYDFEPKFVDLRKGEHYSEEYTKINRFQRVPVIDHNGFILTESIAILKYLSRENIIPEDLYPRESKLQARVEEFLEWQHAGVRLNCAMFFRIVHKSPRLQFLHADDSILTVSLSTQASISDCFLSNGPSACLLFYSNKIIESGYLNPIFTGTPTDPKSAAGYKKRMIATLEDFNTKWLGRGTDFIVGDNITVADLVAACELEQPRMAGYFPEENFENIAVWWKKVRDYFNPHYEEAHVIVNKIVKKQEKVISNI